MYITPKTLKDMFLFAGSALGLCVSVAFPVVIIDVCTDDGPGSARIVYAIMGAIAVPALVTMAIAMYVDANWPIGNGGWTPDITWDDAASAWMAANRPTTGVFLTRAQRHVYKQSDPRNLRRCYCQCADNAPRLQQVRKLHVFAWQVAVAAHDNTVLDTRVANPPDNPLIRTAAMDLVNAVIKDCGICIDHDFYVRDIVARQTPVVVSDIESSVEVSWSEGTSE